MKKEYIEFKGENGYKYNTIIWLPDEEVKCVVQVVHGMTEHMERYNDFASVLTEVGIGVVGFDLRGHGENATESTCASFEKTGWDMSLKDIETFHMMMKKRFPSAKHYLLGFSLGSFLVREYFSVYNKNDFSGAIIMGTGQQPGFILSIIMKIVKGEIKKVGFDNTSDFIRELSFGTYNKKFAPNRTRIDWLISDDKEVDCYLEDNLCKEDISAGLFYQMLSSMKRTANKKIYNKWNKDMPIFLLSGSDDPVGDKEKGVIAVKNTMLKSGLTNVTCKIYEGARHDILHEKSTGVSNKAIQDIKEWILKW